MEPTLTKEILWYPFDERFQTGVTSLYFSGTLLAKPITFDSLCIIIDMLFLNRIVMIWSDESSRHLYLLVLFLQIPTLSVLSKIRISN